MLQMLVFLKYGLKRETPSKKHLSTNLQTNVFDGEYLVKYLI